MAARQPIEQDEYEVQAGASAGAGPTEPRLLEQRRRHHGGLWSLVILAGLVGVSLLVMWAAGVFGAQP